MPTMAIKLRPGVNTMATPSLNEAGISDSNLIRFRAGLPEKRGGWSSYYDFPVAGVPRMIWPWEDLEGVAHAAIGATQSLTVLSIASDGTKSDRSITLKPITDNFAPSFSTTSGSAVVVIHEPDSDRTSFDVVNITTPISVGGLVLSGYYTATAIDPDNYSIVAASPATATVSNAGTVPDFSTVSDSFVATVHQVAHGLSAGATTGFLVPTTLGGVTISGFYTVQKVVDADHFTINLSTQATSTVSGTQMNGGLAQIIAWVAGLPLPPAFGFGQGGYGLGGYGSGQDQPGVATDITSDWTLANFGESLVACPENGPIMMWSPSGGFTTAQINTSAPPINNGILVADAQEMIIAWGSSVLGQQDPLLIRWCDAGNPGLWTAGVTNQAGSYRIPTGSKIMAMTVIANGILIWTDIDVWLMTYVGYPLVWGFNKIASGCGLLASKAFAKLGNSVFWMSRNQFWGYQGSPSVVPCSVSDSVFPVLDQANIDKIRGGANSAFGEAMWFYPTAGGTGENDSYACFNAMDQVWDKGLMKRSAWTDQSILGLPIGADPAGFLYQHETSPDAAGQAMLSFFTTGYFALSESEDFNFVDMMHPDIKFGAPGTVLVQVLVANEPSDTPRVLGPYSIAQATRYIKLNLRGRLIALKFYSTDVGSVWRMGNTRFRFQPNGRR